MKLNVALQIKLPGNVGSATISERIEDFEYFGRVISFGEPANVEVSYVYDGTGFTVSGSFRTVLNSSCARCGEDFKEPFSFDFNERFVRNPVDEDEYSYTGNTIELDTMISDNILLNLPMWSVCSDDCKGKCPICGCNLNIVQCSCVAAEDEVGENEKRNPFAQLMSLMNEDKEV